MAHLCGLCRQAGEEVGVVAVDPTSPFSGGALLGDRIRMGELATDPGIFIRSMATRGSLGGLATTTKEVIDLMDAFGFDRVLVETVGVGQTELEITGATDTVVVVLVPESGDAIQAMKAGLMEIADIFVVNKADRPGAGRLVRELRTSLQLREGRTLRDVPAHHGPRAAAPTDRPEGEEEEGAREIPILETAAHEGEGVADLLAAIDEHRRWLEASGELERRRRERARVRVRDTVERALRRRAWEATEPDALAGELDRILRDEATPYTVAARILEDL